MTTTAAPAALSREQLLKLYRNMVTQRAVDTRGFQLNRQGKIGIAMGSEGHEAVQAGTGLAFKSGRDLLYPYYRNTGLILACGFPLADLFRSQLARAGDRSGGRSIINHVTAKDLGIASISSIIAAQCTHAVGAAWALKRRGDGDRVVFCQFGEGATSQGEWHEAMNFASVHELPVVFVCENNQWAISTHISKQMRVPAVAARAPGYAMHALECDGFDPVAVYRTVREARAHAASGNGPVLVEAHCYRFLSHTTDDDDRTYRTRDEVAQHRSDDPVPKFERVLLEQGVLDADSVKAIRREISELVNRTTDEIEAEPYPEGHTLYGNTYAGSDDAWVH
ncbi:2-oxoisovalerate dehydrogenase subunit alpha [Vulcanimicrobium alpinum]|uniref:2-oxoisovalerate dehydrogenase subunit alpha n=1 Tax=Vulcanimicrobium alpinum TaxID=3016050 RepID=A0AAN2C8R6_UNVUL|nr:thiamine pyrophosphate-dependent dehydrogenase E1 component subunit alpha [Vulcanimicrobium alpinum]BDE05775.1 2-oxoisovalerate dehydrogenase subunit alpha [Vulcanimicrobium alpinum]